MSEQIIINDIDVSLCEYLIKACTSDKEPKCKANTWLRYEKEYAFKEYGYCYRCPDCYYKQLQCTKQLLDKALKGLTMIRTSVHVDPRTKETYVPEEAHIADHIIHTIIMDSKYNDYIKI